jgi:hypothetical protein
MSVHRQTGISHLAFVMRNPDNSFNSRSEISSWSARRGSERNKALLGILTLEDILEEATTPPHDMRMRSMTRGGNNT